MINRTYRMPVAFEQPLFLIAAVIAMLLLSITGPIDLTTQLVLLVINVVIFGLPHGALDPLVANQDKIVSTRKAGILLFLLIYLAALTPILFLWWQVPEIALVSFLMYGAWHFAHDWSGELTAEARTLCGLGLICLPALFHSTETTMIFSMLTGREMDWLVHALALPGMVATAGILLTSLHLRHQNPGLAFELLLILIIAAVLPPLLFFLVYFCFLHSARNIRILIRELKFPKKQIIRVAMIYSLLATTMGIVVFFAVPEHIESQTVMLRILFIGLAALTAPHLLLHIISALYQKRTGRTEQAEHTAQQPVS